MLTPDLFATLDIMRGPHTVDRFSSFRTGQVPHYCSHFPNPGAESIKAFTTTWSGENNWLFPPPFLVPKVIKHLKFLEADETLIMPHWESAPWWPLLIQKKGVFKSFIIDVFVIPPPLERAFLFQQYQETSFLVQGSKVLMYWLLDVASVAF